MELIHGAHPLGVALSQVVVHRHQVDALAGQRIQEDGQRGYQRLAFARRHLGDLALVQHHAAEELHVVVDHVPLQIVAAGEPVGGVYGLVALDGDEILLGGQVAVEIVGRHHHGLVLCEAAGRILHDGERLGQDLVQLLLDLLVDALDGLVHLLRIVLLVVQRDVVALELGLQIDDVGFVAGDGVGDALHQSGRAGAQFVVRKGFDRGIDRLDLLHIGLNLLAVLVGFRAENHLQ